MNKLSKRTKVVLVILSIIAILGITGIIAFFTDTETVTNNAKMGIVNIELNEYMINGGEKVPWVDRENVLPGEVISKIPEIKCVKGAVDCYVRVKVSITCDSEELQNSSEMLTIENLNVNQADWYYCEQDGYFYYKNIITDETDPVQVFSEVTIPNTLDNKWALESLKIVVKAEAIQSRNFEPNFQEGTTEPWPGITADDIQECIYPDHVKN